MSLVESCLKTGTLQMWACSLSERYAPQHTQDLSSSSTVCPISYASANTSVPLPPKKQKRKTACLRGVQHLGKLRSNVSHDHSSSHSHSRPLAALRIHLHLPSNFIRNETNEQTIKQTNKHIRTPPTTISQHRFPLSGITITELLLGSLRNLSWHVCQTHGWDLWSVVFFRNNAGLKYRRQLIKACWRELEQNGWLLIPIIGGSLVPKSWKSRFSVFGPWDLSSTSAKSIKIHVRTFLK